MTRKRVVYNKEMRVTAIGYYSKITGKETGTWTHYDNDGAVMQIEEFKAGKLHGLRFLYYKGGKLHYKSLFANDYFVADSCFYNNPTNSLAYGGQYRRLRKHDGFPNFIGDAVKVGIWTFMSEEGQIDSIVDYVGVKKVYSEAVDILKPGTKNILLVDTVVKVEYYKKYSM